MDIVKVYWEGLFGSQFPNIVKDVLKYIEKQLKNAPLKKDEWECFLEFLKVLGSDFPRGYRMDEAWPLLLDNYYLFYCKNNGIKVEGYEDEE